MKHLYVAWQDEGTREWVPVAMLKEIDDGYVLRYTRGARRCKGFVGLGRMAELDKVYFSKTLFPFFLNRMISKSRPEYKNYLKWLGLNEVAGDPMSIMAVTGGVRATDSFELVPSPHQEGDKLVLDFFPRGLRYMPPSTIETISSLTQGTRLYLVRDVQNPKDANALLLRTDAPNVLVGYMPKYYCSGLGLLLDDVANDVIVEVKCVNTEAPLDMRLLCKLTAPWRRGFQLLESEEDFLPWMTEDADDASGNALQKTVLELDKGTS